MTIFYRGCLLLAGLVAVSMSCCTLSFAYSPIVRQLQKVAVRCCDEDNDPAISFTTPWISDHQLAHVKNGKLYCFDLLSKRDRPLDVSLRGLASSSSLGELFISPSGDGKYLLAWQITSPQSWLIPLDGSSKQACSATGTTHTNFWCEDSSRFLSIAEFFADGGVDNGSVAVKNIHSAETNPSYRVLPTGLRPLQILNAVSPSEIDVRMPDHTVSQQVSDVETARADGSTNFNITTIDRPVLRSLQQIGVWNIVSGKPVRQWVVKLPDPVSEVAVSRQGSQAAWLLVRGNSYRSNGALTDISVWISSLDGSGLKEIGWLKMAEAMPDFQALSQGSVQTNSPDPPHGIEWSPDGSYISFNYDGSVWVVSSASPR